VRSQACGYLFPATTATVVAHVLQSGDVFGRIDAIFGLAETFTNFRGCHMVSYDIHEHNCYGERCCVDSAARTGVGSRQL